MRKKKVKKRIRRRIDGFYICISVFSMLVSFCIVSVCGFIQEYQSRPRVDSLAYSAARLADAFDFYNQRRFAK